jgi:succinate dehydrogenase / fumarate reductase, cytochrome b subunit
MNMNGHSSGTAKGAVTRPKYLDLMRIRLPVPGLVSILHRISGLGLFLAIPFLLWLLQQSLSSPQSYVRYRAIFEQPLIKLILIGLLWALFHHLFAGIRFLLLDVHVGLELKATRASSMLVLAAGVVCAIVCGVLLW